MLLHLLLLIASLLTLTLGAELLVRGAVSIAARSGISPVVIGLTVVGFGTSTPEFFTSVLAGVRGVGDIAVGNVVGSNIFNIAVILAATALVRPIAVKARFVRNETWVVIVVAAIPFAALLTGRTLGRLPGTLMVIGLAAYVWRAFRAAGDDPQPSAKDAVEVSKGSRWSVALVVAGLIVLVGGSHLLIVSARHLASGFGMSELAIGLTVVAAGTSAPELVTSLVAAYRGQVDLAVGNIFGSNVFNVLGVLGLTCVIQPQTVPIQTFVLDAPVMLVASVALIPIMMTGGRISRVEGSLLLVGYVAYVVLLLTLAPAWFMA